MLWPNVVHVRCLTRNRTFCELVCSSSRIHTLRTEKEIARIVFTKFFLFVRLPYRHVLLAFNSFWFNFCFFRRCRRRHRFLWFRRLAFIEFHFFSSLGMCLHSIKWRRDYWMRKQFLIMFWFRVFICRRSQCVNVLGMVQNLFEKIEHWKKKNQMIDKQIVSTRKWARKKANESQIEKPNAMSFHRGTVFSTDIYSRFDVRPVNQNWIVSSFLSILFDDWKEKNISERESVFDEIVRKRVKAFIGSDEKQSKREQINWDCEGTSRVVRNFIFCKIDKENDN